MSSIKSGVSTSSISLEQFESSKWFQDEIGKRTTTADKDAFKSLVTDAFKKIAGTDGDAGSISVDDLKKLAAEMGSDKFLSGADLTRMGVRSEVASLSLSTLGGMAGAFKADREKAGISIAANASTQEPNRLATLPGSTPTTLKAQPFEIANNMSAWLGSNDAQSFFTKFVGGGTFDQTKFDAWKGEQLSVRKDIELSRAWQDFDASGKPVTTSKPFMGVTVQDEADIKKYLDMGYVVVQANDKLVRTETPAVLQKGVEGLHGEGDFFSEGDAGLSAAGKAAFDKDIGERLKSGDLLSNVHIFTGTSKSVVSDAHFDELKQKLGPWCAQNGITDMPTSRAQDPDGNLLQNLERRMTATEELKAQYQKNGQKMPTIDHKSWRSEITMGGDINEKSSRFVTIKFDVLPKAGKPTIEEKVETTWTLAKPPPPKLPDLSPWTAVSFDNSGSVTAGNQANGMNTKKMAMLSGLLATWEAKGFKEVHSAMGVYDEFGKTRVVAGSDGKPKIFEGTPAEVAVQMAGEMGMKVTADDIREFLLHNGRMAGDTNEGEKALKATKDAMEALRDAAPSKTEISGVTGTDFTDVGRLKELNEKKISVLNATKF